MTKTEDKEGDRTATLTMQLIYCAQASGLSDEDQFEAHIAATDACLGDLQLRVAMIDKGSGSGFANCLRSSKTSCSGPGAEKRPSDIASSIMCAPRIT